MVGECGEVGVGECGVNVGVGRMDISETVNVHVKPIDPNI